MGGAHALGVDVGNAKLKLCLIHLADRAVRWTSRALPYSARHPRHADFEAGLPAVLAEVIGDARVVTAVACVTNGYAYDDYEAGARHTLGVLAAALPETAVHAFGLDGRAVPVGALDAAPRGLIPFTNGVGAAHLVRRAGGEALVADTGGDTTQVVPVVGGALDPAAAADPAGALDHRLRHGKFTWIGSQSTPLEALADQVEVAGRRYPVIPRGVTFDHVAAVLERLPAALATRLSLFGLHPSRARALAAVAEAVNLDRSMVGDDDLTALARTFHDRAIARLAAAFELARRTVPAHVGARIVVFGLGAWLAADAAARAGIPTIESGAALIGDELATVASVYGAAHRAAELAVGHDLPPRLDRG